MPFPDQATSDLALRSLDAMEGVPTIDMTSEGGRLSSTRDTIKRIYPGLTVAGTIALASAWLAQHYNAPVMLFALMIGVAFHFLHEYGRCSPGINFASKTILRLGVALLGVRITISQILGLGWSPIVIVLFATLTTIGLGWLLSRQLGLNRSFGVLSGGAVGICGASAAMAISSALPADKDRERDTILVVVTVTCLSTVAMITYPMLSAALGLDHTRAGIFLGGTIHDVAQVVGAGYTISPETGDIATFVKLLRVAMLLPVVFAVTMATARLTPQRRQKASAPLPLFLFGFAALVAITSLGWTPKPVVGVANEVSRWCLLAAIAALGMKTSFKDLFAVGWKPVTLIVAETVWIGAVVLAAVKLLP